MIDLFVIIMFVSFIVVRIGVLGEKCESVWRIRFMFVVKFVILLVIE